MILIQDGSQNTNVDKPLRIIGDPYKVQVSAPCWWWWGLEKERDRETGGWARDWHESGEAGERWPRGRSRAHLLVPKPLPAFLRKRDPDAAPVFLTGTRRCWPCLLLRVT